MTQEKSPSEIPLYGGKPVSYSLDPVVLKRGDAKLIENSLSDLLKEIERFTARALSDNSILSQLGLPVNLDPRPSPLGMHIPFARFDLLFDAGKIHVLELNTDGTSGYNIAEWLGGQAAVPAGENPNHRLSMRLLEGLRAHAPKASEIVLMDFPDIETSWEQEDLIRKWSQVIPARMGNPLIKSWSEGALIYRRVLSWQLRSQPDRAKAFLSDWAGDKITVVGGWSSDVGMSKAWPAFINPDVCPETRLLDDGFIKKIKTEKDRWVLKGALSFSGRAVIRGIDLPQARWEASLAQVLTETKSGRPWVAQKKISLPLYEGKPLELGLYMLNGKPAGYLARWGHSDAITESSTEVLRPVRIIS
jgi:hypothetical protein